MDKERIDKLLVEKGLCESRTKAQALIMAGAVLVDGVRIDKAGTVVKVESELKLKESLPFVGRGGLKLEGALSAGGFDIDVKGLIVMDVGSSTGGFTDCLLKRGARKVIAIDVGKGLIDMKLREDERVELHEGCNIRHLASSDISEAVDMAVIDVSFISLTKVLPNLKTFLKAGAKVVALIKPQFEVGKGEVGKGGIVKDAEKHKRVMEEIKNFATEEGFIVKGVMDSPIKGTKGNKEFLIYLERSL
ncbi:MAG: TlyA family RNA methyltransferase [Deltaproteobacteria bacterium]|nr:TlyA family RNA methyltransferase [Deltaproteobacteria bacterium]